MRKIWEIIVYIFSGQASQDQLELYIRARNPANEEERLDAIREYSRMRGQY